MSDSVLCLEILGEDEPSQHCCTLPAGHDGEHFAMCSDCGGVRERRRP